MKKIFSLLALASFISLGILTFASFVQAQTTTEGVLEGCTITKTGAALESCTINVWCDFDANPKCGICCFLNTLYNITDWIFVILVGLASVFVIIGAMTLLMSAGDPSKLSSGRNYILWAAMGLVVGLLARAIPAIVKLAVGQ